jgi:hypothetical protein
VMKHHAEQTRRSYLERRAHEEPPIPAPAPRRRRARSSG